MPVGLSRERRNLSRYASPLSLLIVSLTAGLVSPVSGQAQASIGVGLGSVRYPGGSSASTAAASPSFDIETPTISTGAVGSIASLPGGLWSSQGRAGLWGSIATGLGSARLAIEADGAGVTRSDGIWSGAASGLAEILWSARSWGIAVGAGPSAGWIVNTPQVTAFHSRGRAWFRSRGLTYAANVEPTHFLGAWFTDVTAGVTLDEPRAAVSIWGGARLSPTYGSKGAGSITVQYFVFPTLALELGGGAYLPDPYQGLPRAGYATAGFRFFARRRSVPERPATPVWSPLRPSRRGDSVVVRIRMEGARSVAIAGDWDNWQPHPMRTLGGDLWEDALVLPPGTYRFDLQVDNRDWVVPSGVAIESDRDGGMVALLAVP